MSKTSAEAIQVSFYRESAMCPHDRIEAAAERLRSWPGWSLMRLTAAGFTAEITTEPLEAPQHPDSQLLAATISPHPMAGGVGNYHPRMFADVLAWAITGDPDKKPPHMASYPTPGAATPGRAL